MLYQISIRAILEANARYAGISRSQGQVDFKLPILIFPSPLPDSAIFSFPSKAIAISCPRATFLDAFQLSRSFTELAENLSGCH